MFAVERIYRTKIITSNLKSYLKKKEITHMKTQIQGDVGWVQREIATCSRF